MTRKSYRIVQSRLKSESQVSCWCRPWSEGWRWGARVSWLKRAGRRGTPPFSLVLSRPSEGWIMLTHSGRRGVSRSGQSASHITQKPLLNTLENSMWTVHTMVCQADPQRQTTRHSHVSHCWNHVGSSCPNSYLKAPTAPLPHPCCFPEGQHMRVSSHSIFGFTYFSTL